jgi:hypothetical protein
LPASICRGDKACDTFPRDASGVIFQMHVCTIYAKSTYVHLSGASIQAAHRMGNCLWSRLKKMNWPVLHAVHSNKCMKTTGLYGHGKRTALCASRFLMRLSEQMSQSSLIQTAWDNVIVSW